jgi:hypothetical protein
MPMRRLILAILPPASYPKRIVARWTSRCGATRDLANCSNSDRSSFERTNFARLDLPAMPQRSANKSIRLCFRETYY